ncbi:hypothetical protein AB3X96_07650 [Paraburkholderia sp. BR13439]|uniref:hypothetical protein n=1 Tax=Paraburkholderia sp. BR13439 TaxID=3236996 RepID=UPI0034CEFE26
MLSTTKQAFTRSKNQSLKRSCPVEALNRATRTFSARQSMLAQSAGKTRIARALDSTIAVSPRIQTRLTEQIAMGIYAAIVPR